MDPSNKIEFLNDNPGAVRFGNFINYYEFHPAANRIKLFPTNIWNIEEINGPYLCLDIGCNAGDLTVALYKFLQQYLNNEQSKNCSFFGVDIDSTLILRAKELTKNEPAFYFQCCDIMNDTDYLNNYLEKFNKHKFNVSFCLSVTMWIHLNHGDAGLEKFFKTICDISDMVVVEPQPWKCYKTAVKRLKQAKTAFPMFEGIKNRQNVEIFIENILKNYNFNKIYETPEGEWGRKICFYKRNILL